MFFSLAQYCSGQEYLQWFIQPNVLFDFTKYKFTNHDLASSRGSHAIMTDSNGRILFYHTRYFIANREHKPMSPQKVPGPFYTFSGQEQQTSVALRAPSKPGRYYLLYADKANQNLLSATIDMSLDNGLGGLEKHEIFYTGTCTKMTAVRHSNGTDYWILARVVDTILCFPLTKNGLGPPIKHLWPVSYKYGNLKASIDGKTLIECDNNFKEAIVHEYTFNPGNGSVGSVSKDSFSTNFAAHDVAFSPSDSLYYVCDIVPYTSSHRTIMQYARYDPQKNQTKMRFEIPVNTNFKPYYYRITSGIGLGPDGKIYFIETSKNVSNEATPILGVILKPNLVGTACSIRSNYLRLPFNAYQDTLLASLSFTLHDGRFSKFEYDRACDIQTSFAVLFRNKSHPDFQKFVWYFGDEDSAETTSAEIAHTYINAGIYLVRLRAITSTGYSAWYSDSIIVKPFTVSLSAKDSVGCQYANTRFLTTVTTDSTENNSHYNIDFGDGKQIEGTLTNGTDFIIYHVYDLPGVYDITLTIHNRWGCLVTKKQKAITIITAPKPGFVLSAYSGCAPLSVTLTNQASGDIVDTWYTVNDTLLQNVDTLIFTRSGIFRVKQYLLGPTGCITVDSADVTLKKGFSPDDRVNLANVTVKDNKVRVVWRNLPNAKQYSVFRGTTGDTVMNYLTTVSDTVFTDSSINPSVNSYSYFLTAIDSCGRLSETSKPGQTIHLSATESDSGQVLLSWNTPILWQNGVEKFSIDYKDEAEPWQFLVDQNTTGFLHQDFVRNLQLQACYRILANEMNGNEVSSSNEVCVALNPYVWVPNAFTPNGNLLNDTFEVKGIGVTDIAMTVICRDRGRVFTSIPAVTFWDGNLWKNGRSVYPMPPGVYLYFIQAKGKDGWIYKSGLIHLIK